VTFELPEPPPRPEGRVPPRPWEGMVLVGCCAILFTAAAPFARILGLPGRFLLLPAVVFLLPSLLWALVRGVPRACFPAPRLEGRTVALVTALILGGSLAALGIAGLSARMPLAPHEDEATKALLLSVGPGWRFLYFALAPALFEESLFRGALLCSLRSWGIGPATFVSAVAFAGVHASLFKFVPVALLGWVLGQAVMRTGNFWVAVVGHAAHNGGVLWAMGLQSGGADPPSSLLFAVTLGGLLLVSGTLVLGFGPAAARKGLE
jgi:membrane protease YdiL (CAAX protease family)